MADPIYLMIQSIYKQNRLSGYIDLLGGTEMNFQKCHLSELNK